MATLAPNPDSPEWVQWAATKISDDTGLPETLQWVWHTFGNAVALASSFGAEDMVLIHAWCQICPEPLIFYLDTGLLFPQTYALLHEVEARYRIRAVQVTAALSLEDQAQQWGNALWSTDPDQCCRIRKVQPLQAFLAGRPAWMTGIRREQSLARRHAALMEWDEAFGLIKINPLVLWTQADVFRYLKTFHVPYNPLHDQGYPSIGCIPCTRPVQPGEDPRAGRWPGKEKTECGLHLPPRPQ